MKWTEPRKFSPHRLSKTTRRFDCEYLDPRHDVMYAKLQSLGRQKDYRIKNLGLLCDILQGKTADQYVTSGVPVIKLRNVTNEGIDWNTDFVLREFFDENPDTHVRPNDVLVTCTGDGTIGRADIVEKDIPCMIAVDLVALRVKQDESILPRYVTHYLRSIFGQMQFERQTVGSTGQTHLRDIEQVQVLYPEGVGLQEEIVEACERHILFALQRKHDYESYITKARIEINLDTNSLQKSRFFMAKLSSSQRRIDFEYANPRHRRMEKALRRLAREKDYQLDTIDNLCVVSRGKTADQYVTSGVPIIKVRNVTGEGLDWDTDYILRDFYDRYSTFHLQPNDVLITSTGDGTIGRVDFFEEDTECMTDGHVTFLRVKDSTVVISRYVMYYLRSVLGQMQTERYTVGSTGQTELNMEDIRKIIVLYPKSIDEQARLVEVALRNERNAIKARQDYMNSLEKARTEFIKFIGQINSPN